MLPCLPSGCTQDKIASSTHHVLSEELSVIVHTAHSEPIYATLHADEGIVVVLVALASLAVAALGLYTVVAIIKALRNK